MAGDMLGGEHGVFHPGIARNRHPLVHVELVGCIERGWVASVGKFRTGVGAHAEAEKHAIAQGFPLLQLIYVQALGAAFSGDISFNAHGVCCENIHSGMRGAHGSSPRCFRPAPQFEDIPTLRRRNDFEEEPVLNSA